MKLTRRLPLVRTLCLTAFLALCVPSHHPLRAQAPPVGLDVQEAQQALQLFNQGKFAEAAKIYEGIPTKYYTSPVVPEANFRLGYCYYFMGEYDKAVAALQKNLQAKNVMPEMIELTASFIPQVLAAKAEKLPQGEPRKAAFQTAIKEFDAFIAKFPQSEEVEAANYHKARAHYSIEAYEDAATALRANIQKFPQSPSVQDTQFMLALTLGTQANVGLAKGTGQEAAANAAYDEAGRLLGDIIGKRTDLALANDAQFQLAEIQAARANFEKDPAQKAALLQRALTAYRAVLPKEEVIKVQKSRLAYIEQLKTESLRAGNTQQFKRLQRFLEKEQEKLANLEQRADQTVTAKVKSGQIFISMEKFDETRVLLSFIQPHVEDADQKKMVAYFIALTYAAQNLTDKAVEHYDKFMQAYPKDPIAENLALLVGLAFLAKQDSDNAIKYFEEQAKNYPQSSFTADAVMRQALALIPLERFDEAEGVLKKFLAGTPTNEQAAAAMLGLATIYQKTNKIDDAIKTFDEVRTKYPDAPETEQAYFWIGQMTLSKSDFKGALEELKKFLDKYPDSELKPAAMLYLGQAQAESGDKDAALRTYKELAQNFPQSEPAPMTYFQRAALHQKEQQLTAVRNTMKEFIEKYPDSDRLFGAYDYIGQIQVLEKTPLDAIATYEEFVSKRPDDPDSAKALVKIGNLWMKYGEGQGPFLALNETQRAEWRKGIDNAVTAAEKVLEKFPESPEVSLALQLLLTAQKNMLRAKLKTEEDSKTYFQDFAKKFDSKPATKNKILFALAGFVSEKDENGAFEIMKSAYDGSLIYAPADLDLYGTALIKRKQFEDAEKVYAKLAKDNPMPPNVPIDRVARSISEAQAMAIFGVARILQGQGKTAEAAKKFEELKANYPWSPKLLDADYGIAEGLAQEKKYEEAMKLLSPVAKAPHAPPNLRARAMLLIGKISEEQGDIDAAINNYVKIGAMFEAETELAPEGLWRGAQLIEKKIASGRKSSK